MSSFFLAPGKIQVTQLIPGGNTPANGGQLFLYAAGSTTKQTAYKDNAGNSAWTNPIVLDSGGNLPSGGQIWFTAGQTYKAVLAPSNDTDPPSSPYWTEDNLPGINDTTATQTEWQSGPQPTFISASQFTLSGDQTGTFVKSRRLKFTVTAGTVYGTITKSAFAVNTTTVDVAFASGALDAGLTAVSYSLLAADNPSINADYANKQASSVVASATTNIWGVAGNSVHITGNVTTAIQAFSTQPYTGALRHLIFDGISQLTHNASSLVMPGAANVTTAVGDAALVYADNASTRVLALMRANGAAVNAAYQFVSATTVAAGSASVNLTGLSGFTAYDIVFDNLLHSSTNAKLVARMSTSNGASFDSAGNYAYSYLLTRLSSTVVVSNDSDSSIELALDCSTSSGNGLFGTMRLVGLNSPHKGLTGKLNGYLTTNNNASHDISGRYFGSNNAVNAIQLMPASSTFAAGTVSVWGIKNVA
jgi:hypothetical protein